MARAKADGLQLVKDRSQAGQDAYLHALARHAAQLGELPPVDPQEFGSLTPPYKFELIQRGPPFAVIYWRTEPGRIYPVHNHPNTNVCTLCTSGRARVRNFHVPSAPPVADQDQAFEVIETGHEFLEPGAINLVGEKRNNVHWFEAGASGAEGIDLSTTVGGMLPFSFMHLSAESRGLLDVRRYAARWVGKDARRAL